MVAQALYLHAIPQTSSGKVVQLNPDNITPQELAAILAAMTQALLADMSKIVETLAEQQSINAEASQLDVGAAKAVQAQEQAAEQAYLQKLQEEEHPPIWKQVLDFITKYVAPVVMCLITGVVFGPAAGIISAIIFLATAVPVKDQQSLVSLATSGIVNGLAKDFGWSAATTEVVQGVFNVVCAAVLAVVTEGATSSAVAEQAVVESAESTLSSNAGKVMAFNTFSSVTVNTNCWHDIALGSWQVQHGSQNDQETGELIASIFGAVMNLLTAIASVAACGKFAGESIQEGTNLAELLGKPTTTTVLKALNYMNGGVVAAKVGSSVDQAFENKDMADLTAQVTEKRGELQYWEGWIQVASGTSGSLETSLQNRLSEYDTLLGRNENYASVEFTAAKEMAIVNNKA